MLVKDIMTKDVELVSPALSVQAAAKIMRDRNVGSLPVGEDGELTGMITDRDIACRAMADGIDPAAMKVRDVASASIFYCYDDQDIQDAVRVMEAKHIRRLAVFNRDKRMVGLLSVDDVAGYSHRLAGEIVDVTSH
jgi:CBS domain-containing protein